MSDRREFVSRVDTPIQDVDDLIFLGQPGPVVSQR